MILQHHGADQADDADCDRRQSAVTDSGDQLRDCPAFSRDVFPAHQPDDGEDQCRSRELQELHLRHRVACQQGFADQRVGRPQGDRAGGEDQRGTRA